jgi:hypothetical protein
MYERAGNMGQPSNYSLMEYEIIRHLPDGLKEIRLSDGTRWRVQFFQCVECEERRPERCFTQASPVIGYPVLFERVCDFCKALEAERYWKDRADAKTASDIRFKAAARERARGGAQRRMAALMCAKVRWRDIKKISEIYSEARRMTIETGVMHHVDHYYPLQGRFCCGLHVHENLKVTVGLDNRKKSNGMPMRDSPALAEFLKEGKRVVTRWLDSMGASE